MRELKHGFATRYLVNGIDTQDTSQPNSAFLTGSPSVWTVDFDLNRIFFDEKGVHLSAAV